VCISHDSLYPHKHCSLHSFQAKGRNEIQFYGFRDEKISEFRVATWRERFMGNNMGTGGAMERQADNRTAAALKAP
jgi:hypothetical protein